MILANLRLQARIGLNEITPRFWSNAEIDSWINEGCRLMCSEAQCLTEWAKITMVNGQQEYALPDDIDQLYGCWFLSGTLLIQRPIEEIVAKFGSQVQGTPMWFYIRKGSKQYANQVAGSDIQVTDIKQNLGRKTKVIIGLYPVPSIQGPLTIAYFARHYMLVDDADEPAIDDEYQRGVIDYAMAKAYEKRSATQQMNDKMKSFQEYTKRFTEKMEANGQVMEFARMKIPGRERDDFGGSSWIYVGDAT